MQSSRSSGSAEALPGLAHDSHVRSEGPGDIVPFNSGGVDDRSIKINSLPLCVRSGGIRSGDDPYTNLIKEVQYLVGIPINYDAVMEIGGFETMINKSAGSTSSSCPTSSTRPTTGSTAARTASACRPDPIISTAEPQWPSSGVDTAAAATG